MTEPCGYMSGVPLAHNYVSHGGGPYVCSRCGNILIPADPALAAKDAEIASLRAIAEAARALLNRCYDHEAMCCEEWCGMCQRERAADSALRAALARRDGETR